MQVIENGLKIFFRDKESVIKVSKAGLGDCHTFSNQSKYIVKIRNLPP